MSKLKIPMRGDTKAAVDAMVSNAKYQLLNAPKELETDATLEQAVAKINQIIRLLSGK